MAKYVFIYHTPRPRQPPRLPPRSRWRPSWGSGTPGAARVGDRLIDFGTPLAGGTRVTTEGTSPSTRDVAGYSILEADDLDTALDLARNHPHLNMPGG